MQNSAKEALRATLKRLKGELRGRRANAYNADDEQDEETKGIKDDESSEMASGSESGRGARSNPPTGGNSEKMAGKEGHKDDPLEEDDWRSSQKDFMKGRSTRKPLSSMRIVENFTSSKKKTDKSSVRPAKGEKKREAIS